MACQLPQSQGKPSASVGRAHPGTGYRSSLALLARLAGAARPTRPTTALPQIAQLEPIRIPFPRYPTALPWAGQALHNALRRLSAPTVLNHRVTPAKIRAAFLAGRALAARFRAAPSLDLETFPALHFPF
jgi:hypothetical protein